MHILFSSKARCATVGQREEKGQGGCLGRSCLFAEVPVRTGILELIDKLSQSKLRDELATVIDVVMLEGLEEEEVNLISGVV